MIEKVAIERGDLENSCRWYDVTAIDCDVIPSVCDVTVTRLLKLFQTFFNLYIFYNNIT